MLASLSFKAMASEPTTNPPSGDLLLLNNLGQLVAVPTNEVHKSLLPPSDVGLERQLPTPEKGAPQPAALAERTKESQTNLGTIWFPSAPPPLAPYLASQDEYGNTAVRDGALLSVMPMEPWAQGAKYRLSDLGLRYSLKQTLNYANLTDVMQGDNVLGFYTLDFKGKWSLYDSPDTGTAGWLSAHFGIKTGLNDAGATQSAHSNLGTFTQPIGIWSRVNGIRVQELAWQQSLREGELVVVAGMVNQGDYFDANAYASTGRGQFINSALIDTMVVPLPAYSFGMNVQWQPAEEWYGMLGTSVGNGDAGQSPWTDFTWDNWSVISEFGFSKQDFLGLGPGLYRIQPFLGQAQGGPLSSGVGFNAQQQLGLKSPFGWFGRFGFGGKSRFQSGDERTGGGAQLGTGFVMQAPLAHLGVVPRLRNDLFGVGFVWSHPTAGVRTIYHPDEFVLETFYTLQLAPMAKLQPDLQIVWKPAYNPDPGPAAVIQLQFILAW